MSPSPAGSNHQAESSFKSKALKRGDACLACRRRRIRCPAERPTCSTCSRLSKECVYDDGKSLGRIARLKERIAELEQHISDHPSETLQPEQQAPVHQNSEPGDHLLTTQLTNLDPPRAVVASNLAPEFPAPSADSFFDSFFQPTAFAPVEASTQEYDYAPNLLASCFDFPGALVPVTSSSDTSWFDPNDVPNAVRDHLIDLFLSNTGVFTVMLHVPTFCARLSLPRSQRPHPALLYAMYVVGTGRSTRQALRDLQPQFLEIAQRNISDALAENDRLVDVIRAQAVLANHFFMTDRYSAGYHIAGAAVRLAVSCGLHRIPTAVWKPSPAFNPILFFTLRSGGYALPPPTSPAELGERIFCFWMTYEMDQCTAIAFMWDAFYDPMTITTPLPRPFEEYSMSLVTPADDVPLSSIFDPTVPGKAHNSFRVIRLQALALLNRAIAIRRIPVVVDPSPWDPRFAQVKAALDRFCDNLPPTFRSPWPRWDDGADMSMPRVAVAREASVVQFLVGNAYLQLWNVNSLEDPNIKAVFIARRVVNLILLFSSQKMSNGYGPFLMTIWNEVAMTLLRETKRLQMEGRALDAMVIDADLDVVTNMLKSWASAASQTVETTETDVAALNLRMLDSLRAASLEEWAAAVAEARRRGEK